MNKRIHVAIASTTSQPGEVAANLLQIEDFARRAGAEGADILLTPELSASGYGPYPEVLATAETAGSGPIYKALARCTRSTGVALCAGFVEAHGKKRYLAHYVIHPDGAFVIQRKHRVTLAERPLDPSVPLSGHPEGASDPADPGQPRKFNFSYFQVKGIRCGIAICADGGIENLDAIFSKNHVELVLAPAGAGGIRADRVTTADLKMEAGRAKYLKILEGVFFPGDRIVRCIRNRTAFAAVNLCGYDGRRLFHVGHGMIINPMGEVVGFFHGLPNLDRQRAMYAHAEIDLSERVE